MFGGSWVFVYKQVDEGWRDRYRQHGEIHSWFSMSHATEKLSKKSTLLKTSDRPESLNCNFYKDLLTNAKLNEKRYWYELK